MPSPAESEYREVLYCGQSASIPGTLLYTSGELAYVRFRTRHWTGYGGFQNYVVTAIFSEHLRFCEEHPQGAEASGQTVAFHLKTPLGFGPPGNLSLTQS